MKFQEFIIEIIKGKEKIEKLKSQEKRDTKEIKKYYKRMYSLKVAEYVSAALLLLCIFLPLVLIVFFQIDADLRDYKEAAELVSTFTSIILGFVAMTVSLIGMVLSFHNTRQTEDSNLSTTKEFTKLADSITNLKELENRLSADVEKIEDKINGLYNQMGSFETVGKGVEQMQNELNNISSNIKLIVDRTSQGKTDEVNHVPSAPKSPSGGDSYDG